MIRRLLSAAAILVFAPSAAPSDGEPQATGAVFTVPAYYDNIPQSPGSIVAEPKAVDLSAYFPPPGDQGAQGSCVGWAVGYAARTYVEGRRPDRQVPLNSDVPAGQFSPAFIYNSIRFKTDRGACDLNGGLRLSDGLAFLRDVGIASIQDFPYTERDCNLQPSPGLISKASSFRISGYEIIGSSGSMDLARVRRTLGAGKPIIIAASVNQPFMQYRGGIFEQASAPSLGSHAMVVVGFDSAKGAFKLVNSWGANWGEGGYAWVSFTAFATMVREAYAISDPVVPPKAVVTAQTQALEEAYADFIGDAKGGDLVKVRSALAAGLRGDVDLRGDTALTAAIDKLQPEVVSLLLSAGANPNIGQQGEGSIAVLIDAAFSAGRKPQRYPHVTSATVPKILQELLAHGGRVNLLRRDGYSTLCDVDREDGQIYGMLIRAGAKCIRPALVFGGGA